MALGGDGGVSTLKLGDFWNPAYSDGGTVGRVVLMTSDSLGQGHKNVDEGYLVRTLGFDSVARGEATAHGLP